MCKQQKNNPTEERSMPSNLLCLKGKARLSVLRVRYLIKHNEGSPLHFLVIKYFTKKVLKFLFLLKNMTRIRAYIDYFI